MEFELKNIYDNEPDETVRLPDRLPSDVGDKAVEKLNADIESKKGKSSVSIKSSDYAKVKTYIVKTMLKRYADEDIKQKDIASESSNKIARYYWDKLQFSDKKK